MRTAKQKRVVAFRTYLRTLLHEVGHHLDYTVLRLPESYHTEGFYKRESSLFHQLVTDPEEERGCRRWRNTPRQPREQRIKRLERTADELAGAIRAQSEAVLARRPDAKNWAAKEVVCHLRDTEESFMARFETIMATDNPRLAGPDPDRWPRSASISATTRARRSRLPQAARESLRVHEEARARGVGARRGPPRARQGHARQLPSR